MPTPTDPTPAPSPAPRAPDAARQPARDPASGPARPPHDAEYLDHAHPVDGARSADDYTEEPGSHRRAPEGPALDVGG